MTIWLTGLPSSGKSTLAAALARRLAGVCDTEILDGDQVRRELFPELGFCDDDRRENVRRIGRLALMLGRHGVLAIVPVIAPFQDVRKEVRETHLAAGVRFAEVFVDAPLATCVARDVKGLYARALRGEFAGMTGLDGVYEAPEAPDLRLDTAGMCVVDCVEALVRLARS
jgi:adenylylsulfate kinase